MQQGDGDEYERIDASQWLRPDEPLLTPERRRKGDLVTVESDRGGAETRSFAQPLMFYLLREHITRDQYRAGHRYACLWRNSILRTRYAQMQYTELRGTFDPDTLHAVPQAFLDAQAAIRGEVARRVVFDVCCEERKAGKRGQMDALRAGLDDLTAWFKAQPRPSQTDNQNSY